MEKATARETVVIHQNFSLFCCTEQYSINFPERSSHYSESGKYFVCYTYPDGTTTYSSAQLTSTGVFKSRSPEYDYPCTVHAKLCAFHEHREEIAEFSLDLVSPVEYLFRKFSANEFEMSDKISDKMTSALLAMSLSYYYVMGEHVEKEARTDEILSTLLNCSEAKVYMNTTKQIKDSSSEESITQFAEHFKLQSTLQYLSGGASVGDLPLPKPLFPPAKKAPLKKPAIIPREKVNSPPANNDSNLYQLLMANNEPPSEYTGLQPTDDPDTEYVIMENPNTQHYQKSLSAAKSSPSIQCYDQTSSLPPARPSSAVIAHSAVENVTTNETNELWASTPAEAAAAAVKKRGPPPKLPAPYQESQTSDKAKQPGRKISEDSESSLYLSLQEVQIPSTVKVLPQKISPLPRKKFNLFHKQSS